MKRAIDIASCFAVGVFAGWVVCCAPGPTAFSSVWLLLLVGLRACILFSEEAS